MENANRLARRGMRRVISHCGACLMILASPALPLAAQTLGDYSTPPPSSAAPSGAASAIKALSQGPFGGSVPEGKATPDVLPLSFQEAIERGLRSNLGLLLQSDSSLAARGQRWEELSNLLPNLSAAVTENALQTNLQAEGLRFLVFQRLSGPMASSMPESI